MSVVISSFYMRSRALRFNMMSNARTTIATARRVLYIAICIVDMDFEKDRYGVHETLM